MALCLYASFKYISKRFDRHISFFVFFPKPGGHSLSFQLLTRGEGSREAMDRCWHETLATACSCSFSLVSPPFFAARES